MYRGRRRANRRTQRFVPPFPDVIADRAGLKMTAGPIGSASFKKGAGPLLCPIPGLLDVKVCFVMSQQNVRSTTGRAAGCIQICDVHCEDALLAEASR